MADKRSVTKEDLVQGLAERDIHMDDHRLSYHVRMAEFAGVLCSGDLLPLKASYALAADKMPAPAPMDRDEARTRGFQKGRCLLLAPYDEYLISYKSRDIVLHPDHTPRAHNNTGNFWPVFLLDGQVVTRYLDYLKR